jgi:glycerol-3-phosphate dehydrogenase (NAD(P)+)
MTRKKIVVVGDGGWGTTLAILLSNKGHDVTLWSAFSKQAERLERTRENKDFLKGVKIPRRIRITAELACLADSQMGILAVPSQYLRLVLDRSRKYVEASRPVVSVVKGIETRTLLRMSEVVREVWGSERIAVLSGPTIAMEVARGLPSTAVAAAHDDELMLEVQDLFMTLSFRIYANPDVVGVELGGSFKNVIAIACGISDGLGFGSNAKAAIVARGLVEMGRLGEAMGARRETFAGIAGLGDLVTTCFNALSRNHHVGERIGAGVPLKKVMASMKMVAEGVPTAKAVWRLAKKYGVESPIANEIYRVLFQGKSPRVAVEHLMSRERKVE